MANESGNIRTDSAARVIMASPHAIYQSFMNPKSLVSWLPPKGMSGKFGRFDSHEGGTYKIILTYEVDHSNPVKTSENTDVSQGECLELVPDKQILLSVTFDSKDPVFLVK